MKSILSPPNQQEEAKDELLFLSAVGVTIRGRDQGTAYCSETWSHPILVVSLPTSTDTLPRMFSSVSVWDMMALSQAWDMSC